MEHEGSISLGYQRVRRTRFLKFAKVRGPTADDMASYIWSTVKRSPTLYFLGCSGTGTLLLASRPTLGSVSSESNGIGAEMLATMWCGPLHLDPRLSRKEDSTPAPSHRFCLLRSELGHESNRLKWILPVLCN